MKRILLRISALATVVALGLIVMAQAKGWMDHADASDATTSNRPSGNIHEPPKLPPDSNANPLRPQPLSPLHSDVRQISAETSVAGLSGDPTPATRSTAEGIPWSADSIPTPPSDRPLGYGAESPPFNPAVNSLPNLAADALARAPDGLLPSSAAAGAAVGGSSDTYLPPATTMFSSNRVPVGAAQPLPPLGPAATVQPTNELPPDITNHGYTPRASTTSAAGLGDPRTALVGAATGPQVVPSGQPGLVGGRPSGVEESPYARSLPPADLPSDASAMPMVGNPLSSGNPYTAAADPGNPATPMGTGAPGDRKLDGPQAPQLTVQKIAPGEIRVGEPAVFRVTVRNTGTITAAGVEIHDEVPRKTRLLGTTPRASQEANGKLVWRIGALEPEQEVTVEMELMPIEKGPEVGSVATVHFQTAVAARTVCTQPLLALHVADPQPVRVGEDLVLQITIANPGDGVASGVMIENQVPAGFEHPKGADLKYELGDLQPGEERKLDLTLSARQMGPAVNVLVVRASPNLRAEVRKPLVVVEPRLSLTLEGPSRRYLEREAVYTIAVANQGTASARLVELATQLPQGMEFVSADNNGFYDEAKRTVYWMIQELPQQEAGQMRLTMLPVAPGEQILRCETSDSSGTWDKKQHSVLVEGIAAIFFEVVDVADPIEVGEETTYEIRVVNQGTKAATNVQVTALVPAGLRVVGAEGPTPHGSVAGGIGFQQLARLAPKADQTYHIRVQGVAPGDQRLRVQLTTDDTQTPITKEESTRVYTDE